VSSLRASLLVWLLGGVVLVGAAGGWIVYLNALSEADTFFDYELRQTALLLVDQPVEYQLETPLPPSDAAYDFVVQVWTIDGTLLYWSQNHKLLPAITKIGFSDVTTPEGRWRVYGVQRPTKVVQVAQPMSVRQEQAAVLALRALRPFALLLPVLAILIWVAVGHALEPLKGLTLLVKSRSVHELQPLPDQTLPDEVRPLVSALNDLLARLGAALGRERAFMLDAAHELRTPLTALHLQMGALARAATDAERLEATEKLSAGVQRAIRLVEQLLSLSRQESRVEPARVQVALDQVAREVVTELIPVSDAKSIDLGISESQRALVVGDPDALHTLLRNLVDNAVRYTPAGGRVDVSVLCSGEPPRAVLRVVDTGPGIPPEDRSRVFDRFYRRPGTSPPGSGLGLAIVKSIAEAHAATVTLDSGPGGAGLAVTLTFTAPAPRPSSPGVPAAAATAG
jgi:two-component system, OmpR family, sensor kinase